MKSTVLCMLVTGINQMILASSADIECCQQILPIITNLDEQEINRLYSARTQNQGEFSFKGTVDKIPYILEPKQEAGYRLSWKVKDKSGGTIGPGGSICCKVPTEWQLTISAPINIVYPRATHGLREESAYQQIDTVTGIYLGKSKFSIHPDVVRIMWHLSQAKAPEKLVEKIIDSNPFVNREHVSVANKEIDQTDQVQLVALHISDQSDIEYGGQRWLLTNAQDQKAIRESCYGTDRSPHNTWLPWFDRNHPEFSSDTAHEAYQKTMVAPLAQAKIFDRSLRLVVPDPLAITNKMQEVFDLIAPLAYATITRKTSFFIHLLLRNKLAYELLTFEALATGAIEPRMREQLTDPSQIGLPTAVSLGFFSDQNMGGQR